MEFIEFLENTLPFIFICLIFIHIIRGKGSSGGSSGGCGSGCSADSGCGGGCGGGGGD